MARSAPFRRKLSEDLRDPNFAREYTAELERLRIAEQIARARQEAGLTQAGLAQRMGTSQPAVARLERGDYWGSTLTTLAKVAHALGRGLRVELPPAARFMRAAETTKAASGVKYAKKPLLMSAAKKGQKKR